MNNKINYLALLKKYAELADDVSRHYYYSRSLQVERKMDKTVVTEADREIERKIRDLAAVDCPEWAVLGEEYGQCDYSEPLKLIIDPIDGTQNFVRKLPFFGSLLAFEKDGEVVAGHVSCPLTQEQWWAEKGSGAFYENPFVQDLPLQVSDIMDLAHAQGLFGSLFGQEAKGNDVQKVVNLLSKTYRQRGIGDFYTHMLVANGSGEFAIDFNLKPWDMAALKVIVEEAGGKVTDIHGESTIYTGTIVSSNSYLHQTVLDHL